MSFLRKKGKCMVDLTSQKSCTSLIQSSSAFSRAAITTFLLYVAIRISNMIQVVVVMIRKFLQWWNVLRSKEHYVGDSLVIMIIKNILCIKIWRTAVIDESAYTSILGCINCITYIFHGITIGMRLSFGD
eukprot:Gb_22166 [translate_table: standard]